MNLPNNIAVVVMVLFCFSGISAQEERAEKDSISYPVFGVAGGIFAPLVYPIPPVFTPRTSKTLAYHYIISVWYKFSDRWTIGLSGVWGSSERSNNTVGKRIRNGLLFDLAINWTIIENKRINFYISGYLIYNRHIQIDQNPPPINTGTFTINRYGIGTGLGIKFFLNKTIYLGTELAIAGGFGRIREHSTNCDCTSFSDYMLEISTNRPLSFLVGIKF